MLYTLYHNIHATEQKHEITYTDEEGAERKIPLSEIILENSKLLKEMIEGQEDQEIPMPILDGKNGSKILRVIEDILKGKLTLEVISVEVISVEDQVDLLNVANFLHIPSVLEKLNRFSIDTKDKAEKLGEKFQKIKYPTIVIIVQDERFLDILSEKIKIFEGKNSIDEITIKTGGTVSLKKVAMFLKEGAPLLKSVSIQQDQIDMDGIDELIEVLANMTQLENFSIDETHLIQGAMWGEWGVKILESLGNLKNLRSLSLGRGFWGLKKLGEIIKNMPNLEDFSLKGAWSMFREENDLAKALSECKKLESLSIEPMFDEKREFLEVTILPYISKLKTLKRLYFRSFKSSNIINSATMPKLIACLKEMPQLEHFEVFSPKLGNSHLIRLIESLTELKNLTSLVIGGNELGDEGLRALIEILPTMKNLKSLSIKGNFTPETLQQLDAVLKTMPQPVKRDVAIPPPLEAN